MDNITNYTALHKGCLKSSILLSHVTICMTHFDNWIFKTYPGFKTGNFSEKRKTRIEHHKEIRSKGWKLGEWIVEEEEGNLLEGFNFNNSFGIESHETLLDGPCHLLRRFRPQSLKEWERHDDRFPQCRSLSPFTLDVWMLCSSTLSPSSSSSFQSSLFDFNYSSSLRIIARSIIIERALA